MSLKIRHFDNPFDDYSIENSDSLIIDGKPSPTSKIMTSLNTKWENTVSKFHYLDFNDYSIYTGTSGVALLILLKNPTDTDTLKEAKDLLCLNKLRNKRQSFLCGDAGPLAVGAIVCDKLGEKDESQQLVNRLILMKDAVVNARSDLPNEYLYGRAGYLFALLYVNKNLKSTPVPKELIREVIEAIITCGQTLAESEDFECPLMYEWHDSYYLGAAHGVSGIMYMLLQASEYLTEDELTNIIRPTIDYLETLKYPSGNYPSSIDSENDKYIQWCHGAPGFVYLFSMAYRVYNDPKYLEWALEAGDVVWERGLLRKGYSICHGVAGNAYPFLQLYQTTSDEKHLYRAMKYAEWCLTYSKDHEQYAPDRPLSLFEGISGPMYLLVDIQNPSTAKFPGFTL